MPECANDALIRFAHKLRKFTHQPHKDTLPVYGRTIQNAKEHDTTPNLDKEGTTFVQQVTGVFLYYALAVDLTMLSACVNTDLAIWTTLTIWLTSNNVSYWSSRI